MERIPIANSSSLAEAGYDAATQVLEVKFPNGSTYQFFQVPENLAMGLLSPWVGSAGQYFEMNIRNTYPYEKL